RRGDQLLGADLNVTFQKGDIIAIGGRLDALTSKMGLIGPETDDARVLSVPLDQAEILVTNSEAVGKPLKEYRDSEIAGQVALTRIERGGVPIPIGLETTLKKRDVLFVTGLKSAVTKAGSIF